MRAMSARTMSPRAPVQPGLDHAASTWPSRWMPLNGSRRASKYAVAAMWRRARSPWPVMSIVYERSGLKRGATSGSASRSSTVVRIPRRASAAAATRPAGPPPMIAICCGFSVMAPPSGDLHLGDPGRGGARGHEERQQRERVLRRRGIDRPPDRVAARSARGERAAVAQRAVVAAERGERDTALVRLVAVVDQVARHAMSLAARPRPDIGRAP